MKQQRKPKTSKAAPDGTRPTKPQDIVDGFTFFAGTIRERARGYAYRQDAPELARVYDLWRGSVDAWRLKNRPDLPPLPPLPGSNFFAGMANLADYCTMAAQRQGAADTKAVAPDSDVDRRQARARKKIRWLSEAMTLVSQFPHHNDATIARMVDKHPSTLSRNRTYQQATRIAREGLPPPKGSKDKDGNLEAEAE